MNIQGFSPAIAAPIQGQSANAAAATSGSNSSSSGTSGTSSSSLESTFLNLLVTELQNQDPTSPVDPTEMVSQMVSLNSLDQLISINQTLSNMSTGSSTSPGSAQGSTTAGQNPSAQTNGPSSVASNPISSVAQFLQGPADYLGAGVPGAILNLYSGLRPVTPTNTTQHIGGK
jgi:flagellar basal-body rod modification protein FlgD